MDFDPVAYINEPRWTESRYGLERIQELLDRLGRPQDSLRMIHVAGTNGKGSTCAFLSQILQKAGYRTGLFTSPYIIEFADRIRVNGINIGAGDLMDVTLKVKAVADAMDDHPTEFELMTALAFLYFKQEACDIVVCETGLGGRLDSTNVIERPELSILSSIDMDHTELLGHSLEAIAREKAGIIKTGIPVISWPQKQEAEKVIEKIAAENKSQLIVPDFSQLCTYLLPKLSQSGHEEPLRQVFDYKGYKELSISMLGSFQPYNASLAIEAVEVLNLCGWHIDDGALREGLASARWGGRFEIVRNDPVFVIDGAHNKAAAQSLVQSLKQVFPDRKFIFLVGFLKDKDYMSILEDFIPLAEVFLTIAPPNQRALSADELATEIRGLQQRCDEGSMVSVDSFEDISLAVGHALELAQARQNKGIICAFGSLYSIHDIRRGLGL